MNEVAYEAPKLKSLKLLDHYDTSDIAVTRIIRAFAANGFEVDDKSARFLYRFQDVRLRDVAPLSDDAIVQMLRPYFGEVKSE